MKAIWILILAIAQIAVANDGNQDWRPHLLPRCEPHQELQAGSAAAFAEAVELFRMQNGGDAASVLETELAAGNDDPWFILLLAQIYVLAGQGEPHCMPVTGPARRTGDWIPDQRRVLGRAAELLDRLEDAWPDDGLVDFLRADTARAMGDQEQAALSDHAGRSKCSHVESLQLVRSLRDLWLRAARVTAAIVPEYPEECAVRHIEGEVVLDLLIDPQGRAVESVVVVRADRRLVEAARDAVATGGYQAALLGYYPVWSWLRVPIRFTLEN